MDSDLKWFFFEHAHRACSVDLNRQEASFEDKPFLGKISEQDHLDCTLILVCNKNGKQIGKVFAYDEPQAYRDKAEAFSAWESDLLARRLGIKTALEKELKLIDSELLECRKKMKD